MDMNTAFGIAMGVVSFLGGWFLKVLFGRIERLEQADRDLADTVNELRVELPSRYISKEEHLQSATELMRVLQRIEDKLDRKVDKG